MGNARAIEVADVDFELFLKVGTTCWSHSERPRSWKALHQAFKLGASTCVDREGIVAILIFRRHLGRVDAGVKGGELPSIPRGQLFMCHPKFKVYYSNFNMTDVVSGSLIECRSPLYEQAVQVHGAADAAISKPVLTRSSTIMPNSQARGAWRGRLAARAHALLQSGDGCSRCNLTPYPAELLSQLTLSAACPHN